MRGAAALCVLCILSLGTGCASTSRAGAPRADPPSPAWPTSSPEAQGIDAASLQRMLEDLRQNGTDVDGVVVVRHGVLVFESYRAPYDATTPHNLKSASKSVLSALVGIALREGVLDGVDQRLSALFPEYFAPPDDPRKLDLTLRHLLTMTAGIPWEEISPEADRFWQSDDWVGGALHLPLRDAPGTRFTYSTALTHLASAAIARRSGMTTRAFAEKYLFQPVGIRAGLWRRDPQGIHWGGADLFLTPRDMARFGELYLRRGAWNGRQVVPAEWVAASTRAQVKTGGWGGIDDYGYWWWIDPEAYAALGLGGQVIVVVPEQDLVVVFTGALPERVPLALVRRYVIPAVRPATLAPNPAAERAIAALGRELEAPPRRPPPPIPEAAAGISRASFLLEPNPFGFTTLRLDCATAARCSLVLEAPLQKRVLPIGLDGRYRVVRPPEAGDVPVACQGAWSVDDPAAPSFRLSVVPVGDPVRMDVELTFQGDRVAITLVRKSFDVRTMSFVGTLAANP